MNNKLWDVLWINGQIATMQNGFGLIMHGAIAVKDDRIAWLGPMSQLEKSPHQLAHKVHNAAGRCITPGLIDCHTHLVHAGNRSHEFSLRLNAL